MSEGEKPAEATNEIPEEWRAKYPLTVLWSSNTPFAQTGYGCQTAVATTRLSMMGHRVAIFPFWGHKGSIIHWGNRGQIPIFPNNCDDWGVRYAPMWYAEINADVYFTLVDAWVLMGSDPRMRWVPWTPVDHDPVPPAVTHVLQEHPGLIRAVAMSKFGQRQLTENNIESYYIPHTVNCELYKPMPEIREKARDHHGWKDKFVVGTVATNHGERKNWTVMMKAMKVFCANHPGEVVWYMHTELGEPRGINLAYLRHILGLDEIGVVPSDVSLHMGIEDDVLNSLYNCFDVFLLPSKGEGFGIPFIEAQAAGCPVIMTRCTGHEELMGGGWFVNELIPEFTAQNSWQFNCHEEEVVERLEEAYKAKKDGSIVGFQRCAREKALEYDEAKVYKELWMPMMEDISDRVKNPRNLEGVQDWRIAFIPTTCNPRKVIDIGSGKTVPYKRLLEPLGEYVAVDKAGGNGVVVADAEHLPFEDGEFGFAWMSEVLEHVDNPAAVIAEAKRVAKRGICIFSTPSNPAFMMDPDHRVVSNVPYTEIAYGNGLISW